MPLSPAIQNYVDKNILTLQQANSLTDIQCQALENEAIGKLILDGTVTIGQALGIASYQQRVSESRRYRSFLVNGIITVERALELDFIQREILAEQVIHKLLADGTITVEQALQFGYNQCEALENLVIDKLLTDGLITVEEAQQLNYIQRLSLDVEFICKLISDGLLTVGQVLQFSYDQFQTFGSQAIRKLLDDSLITVGQALQFGINQRETLESSAIYKLLSEHLITVEQALQVTYYQLHTLERQVILGLIVERTITFDQALELSWDQCETMESPHICVLIDNEMITLGQALQLNIFSRRAFENLDICALFVARRITFGQMLRIGHNQHRAWENPVIRELFLADDDRITVEQILQLNEVQLEALEDPDTQQRLRDGELTILDVLGDQIPHEGQDIPAAVNINNAQSTHTASVHRTVSESATRLLHRYSAIKNAEVLDGVITTITEAMNALPGGNEQHEAAKRCVARLVEPEYAYTDPTSGVNTRELFALSWLAIHDDTMRTASLDDAMRQFIEGLYEIQRGYNLSESGTDLHGLDVFICSGGTFNKLLEKLSSVHPDVSIEFITENLASLKFKSVVKEEVNNYLAARAKPFTISELTQFTQQIKQIEEEGVEVIWDAIKDKVIARMSDEFVGPLYVNQDDSRFRELIDAGQYVELGSLPSFQKEISESKGYQKYCSLLIRQSRYGLFSLNRSQDIENSLSDADTNIPSLPRN